MLNLSFRVTGSLLCYFSVAIAMADSTRPVLPPQVGGVDGLVSVPPAAPVPPSPGIPEVAPVPEQDPGLTTVTPQPVFSGATSEEVCSVPQPVTATCCEPVAHCATGSGCPDGHCGIVCGRGHCGHIKWCHVHSTCDMYPHYAYYPEHHGYYYFRPYNYTTVLKHQEEILRLGGQPSNPYSVSMLKPLMAEYAERYPAKEDSYEQVLPQRKTLPSLESLLSK